MREAFEKWYMELISGCSVETIEWAMTKRRNEDYQSSATQARWEAWKACWEYRNDNH